jgi:uncharacterized protein (TIGR03435 family)
VRPGSHLVTPEGYSYSQADRIDPTRFRAVNANLAELIEWAYRVRTDHIAGPDEIKSNARTFDVDATMPATTSDVQARLMLQHLLADRFLLVVHSVTASSNGYILRVDNGGSKLKRSTLTASKGIMARGSAAEERLRSPGATVGQFATVLSMSIEKPVLDETHVDGLFEIATEFSKLGPNETDAPTVFEAMKRLGLRLDKAQVPVETIIVDHANFTPTEN